MARFSELRASSFHEMTIPRALLIPAVIAITADGEIGDAEVAHLRSLIAFNPTFAGLSEKALDGMTNSILDDLLMDGRESVIAACVQALPERLHETALCFAVFVAMADGVLAEKEQDSLAEIATALKQSPDTIARISHVTHAMQRT